MDFLGGVPAREQSGEDVDKSHGKAEDNTEAKSTEELIFMVVNPSTGVDLQNIIEQTRSIQKAADVNQPPPTSDAKAAVVNQNQMDGKTPQGDYTFSVYA